MAVWSTYLTWVEQSGKPQSMVSLPKFCERFVDFPRGSSTNPGMSFCYVFFLEFLRVFGGVPYLEVPQRRPGFTTLGMVATNFDFAAP